MGSDERPTGGPAAASPELAESMLSQGWRQGEPGMWRKHIEMATEMPSCPAGRLMRRSGRDSDTGCLVEDLKISATTNRQKMRKKFRSPRNIDVVMEI